MSDAIRSAVPSGLVHLGRGSPALKRRAIFIYPSGITASRISKLAVVDRLIKVLTVRNVIFGLAAREPKFAREEREMRRGCPPPGPLAARLLGVKPALDSRAPPSLQSANDPPP